MIMAVFHFSNSNFFIAKYNKRALHKLHKAEPTIVGMIEKGAINKVKMVSLICIYIYTEENIRESKG